MLSALYFGEQLGALHLGLRSQGVLHYWLPAYDPLLARYSPGTILLLALARNAPALGLHTIDLGKGDEPYKARLMSGSTPLAEGFVDLRTMRCAIKAGWWTARNWVRHSRLRAPAKALAARLTPLYSRFALRKT
jgi:CelD/BcsL family acetyltransferase involved in cellulose biosynthesis